MNDRRHERWRSTCRLAALVLLGLCVHAGTSLAGGVCATATMAEPIKLPGGDIYPAGQLTLCLGRDPSPGAVLHRTYIGRRPIGFMNSRRIDEDSGQEGRDNAFMMFRRDPDGTLALYGYAIPAAGRTLTYVLEDFRRTRNIGDRSFVGRARKSEDAAGTPAIPLVARRTSD